MRCLGSSLLLLTATLFLAAGAQAQTPPRQPPYGAPITLE
jgi:hypothetical protein